MCQYVTHHIILSVCRQHVWTNMYITNHQTNLQHITELEMTCSCFKSLCDSKKNIYTIRQPTLPFSSICKRIRRKKDLPYACTKAQSIYGNLSGRQAHTDSRGLCADHHLLPKNRSLHLAFRWSLYLSCCHLNTLPLRCKSSQKTVEEPKEGSDLEMSSQPKFSGYMDGWISLNYILE